MAKWLAATAVIAVALPLGSARADEPAAGGAGAELCFEFADGTVITGRSDVEVITIRLAGGSILKVPIAEITELTVGLNNTPELVRRVEALVGALDSARTRESAQRELVALGPAVAPIVSRHLASTVSPRRVAVAQVLKAYETWSADNPDAPKAMTRPLELQSKVRAGRATLVGTVTVGRFLIDSPYGRTSVKLGQVRRIRPAEAWTAPASAGRLYQWLVELHDKTRLKGTAIGGSLRVRTRHGTLVVPCGHIRKATIADDGKSIRLRYRNSDRIIGTLESKATISLKTDKGPAEMSTATIAVVAYSRIAIDLDLGKGGTMTLVRIPAGKFMVGSKLSAKQVTASFGTPLEYAENEHARHGMTIGTPFYMGVTEVTQAQWKAMMKTRPWTEPPENAKGDDDCRPATSVGWDGARAFCKALSKTTGRTVRLPAEAEWEYACRAGATTIYSFGDDQSKLGEYAWYRGNAWEKDERYAHRVGMKKPNVWGLYDMHGNANEWCAEESFDSYPREKVRDPRGGRPRGWYRVLRGGSWIRLAEGCRAARRHQGRPHILRSYRGFRVVVEVR